MRDANDRLLKAVRARGRKDEPFARGIGTADAYVRTVSDALGWDRAYKHFSRRDTHESWNDVMTKASRTLVYGNDDMVKLSDPSDLKGIELPKNTLMCFTHVLTSSRKDRDGDVLHSEGATVDPKMPLLWQHVHTSPIGRFLVTREQNPKRLVVCSAIVDINELCHDSAVMVDNGIGRFSHGFRAVDFTKTKEGVQGGGGFDVTQFEIMEESLVSVPANTDAEVEEVLLSLVEGGKMKSPVMRELGERIREKRPVSVGVTLKVVGKNGIPVELVGTAEQLKQVVDAGVVEAVVEGVEKMMNEQGDEHGHKSGAGASAAGGGSQGGGRASGTSGEADDLAHGRKAGGGEAEEAGDAEGLKKVESHETDVEEPKPATCEACGAKVLPTHDGKCPECGADMAREEVADPVEVVNVRAMELEEKTWSQAARDAAAVARKVRSHAIKSSWAANESGNKIDHMYAAGAHEHAERAHRNAAHAFRNEDDSYGARPKVEHHQQQAEHHAGLAQHHWDVSHSGEGKSYSTKAGARISKANGDLIRKAKEHVDDVIEGAGDGLHRTHGAQLREASGNLKTVLDSLGTPEQPAGAVEDKPNLSTASAMEVVLAKASRGERAILAGAIKAIDTAERAFEIAIEYRKVIGVEEPVGEKICKDASDGPSLYEGESLHADYHKGCHALVGKDVAAYLVGKDLEAEEEEDHAKVQVVGEELRDKLVEAGWGHKYFTEDDDKEEQANDDEVKSCPDCGKKSVMDVLVPGELACPECGHRLTKTEKAWSEGKSLTGPDPAESLASAKPLLRKRVDAFEGDGMKATAIHAVGRKGVRVWMSKTVKEDEEGTPPGN